MAKKLSIAAAVKLLKGTTSADVDAGVALLTAMGAPAFDEALEGVTDRSLVDGSGIFRAPRKEDRPLRLHALRAVIAAAPAGTRADAVREEVHWLIVTGATSLGADPARTSGDTPVDLGPVATFANLGHLTVRGAASLTGLSVVSTLEQLVRLDLFSVRGVPTLAPVGALPRLATLDVRNVDTKDLDVSGFPALARLRMTLMSDVERLTLGAPKLVELHADYVKLPALPLAEAPGLEELRILGLEPHHLKELASLTRLERLWLSPLGDVRALPDLPRLTSLRLTGAPATMHGVERYPTLKSLRVCSNILGDLSAVASLRDLETLALEAVYKSLDFAPLQSCTRLEELSVREGSAMDLTGLVGHPKLARIVLAVSPQTRRKMVIPDSLRPLVVTE